ncbi:protein-disulfide reductase DsbD domain-containing protein [Lacibacter sp.]|uniref:protein-disulfide reductase DsbD domain-containing protein n=1 Tax=Lacibacter sp. TaxID=1915409 RepID=UPI002B4B683F|nr:protein-disulfide reductase DsbD domain-containing protein [Lacibacter sp.]HLP38284.1 protein-disulfide reductase DsbD domain-containing protein [Lacibacter sp.]
MEKFITTIGLLFISVALFAQSGSKVKWDYTVKKLADKKYEVRMVANIQPGWHLYSQIQGADAIALPTTITFAKNPLLVVSGKPKEVGKVTDAFDKATQSRSRFYSNKVEFVQVVTVKSNVKTSLTGDVEFMVCDDKQCLPPDKSKFSVKLEG